MRRAKHLMALQRHRLRECLNAEMEACSGWAVRFAREIGYRIVSPRALRRVACSP